MLPYRRQELQRLDPGVEGAPIGRSVGEIVEQARNESGEHQELFGPSATASPSPRCLVRRRRWAKLVEPSDQRLGELRQSGRVVKVGDLVSLLPPVLREVIAVAQRLSADELPVPALRSQRAHRRRGPIGRTTCFEPSRRAAREPDSPFAGLVVPDDARRPSLAAALHRKRRMELASVGLVRVLAHTRNCHAAGPEQRIVGGGYAVGQFEIRLRIVGSVAETPSEMM